ncbi:RNA polymerase sigma factor [Chitinophaga japonensis]|nr:sigma factor [Chitinophaga japonensis]
MNSIDDMAVLSELKQGNIKAYQYFFLKYYKPLCLKAFTMLGSMKKAQDLVQHTFIRIWEQKLYHDVQQSVGGFLYQQVHIDCLNLLSREPKHKTGDENYLPRPNENASEQQELRKQVLSALDGLPAEKLKLALEDIRIRYS